MSIPVPVWVRSFFPLDPSLVVFSYHSPIIAFFFKIFFFDFFDFVTDWFLAVVSHVRKVI